MKTSRGMKKLPVVKKMNVEKYPSKEEDKCLISSGRMSGKFQNQITQSNKLVASPITHSIALSDDKRS